MNIVTFTPNLLQDTVRSVGLRAMIGGKQLKAFLNCPNCGTAGWTGIENSDNEQVAICAVCKTDYPLNHKAVELLSTRE